LILVIAPSLWHYDFMKSMPDNYRPLKKEEIALLEARGSRASDWGRITVKEGFDPAKVENCRFFGSVRIGRLDDSIIEKEGMRLPAGLYAATVADSTLEDNVGLYRVSYLAGYCVGKESLLKDIGALTFSSAENTSPEPIELVNENGGRAIIPFNGIWTADAHLWVKERGRAKLMARLEEFSRRASAATPAAAANGPWGRIGRGCLIHGLVHGNNLRIGEAARIVGSLGLSDLHISSSPERPTEIGRGVELSHGIVGFGCRVSTGSKADHFILADHTTIELGVRLSHVYLGENSTIARCEVSHALLLPFHEQHHNNSFLISALVEGQSNFAAGTTIGSNHSSRRADGEILCRRGFWPALTVSIKHPCRFASFTLLSKEDYPHEMDISLPFSLLSRSEQTGGLVLLPAFWFLYNRYGLERNGKKFKNRDKRPADAGRLPLLYEPLAPDTANEVLEAMDRLAASFAEAWIEKHGLEKLPADTGGAGEIARVKAAEMAPESLTRIGRTLCLDHPELCADGEVEQSGYERSRIPSRILKVPRACKAYREALHLYSMKLLCREAQEKNVPFLRDRFGAADSFTVKAAELRPWRNLGGSLFLEEDIEELIAKIEDGRISSWEEMHDRYAACAEKYHNEITEHAIALLIRIGALGQGGNSWNENLRQAISEQKALLSGVIESRKKDYTDPLRTVTFTDERERDAVLGPFSQDPLITELSQETAAWSECFTSLMD
jgi:hypothetical protein